MIRSKAWYGVQYCIFRRRQKIQVSLARNVGHLRPDEGRVKDNLTAVILSREDDNAGAPEDDRRDGSGKSRLDAAYCNASLENPGNAGAE